MQQIGKFSRNTRKLTSLLYYHDWYPLLATHGEANLIRMTHILTVKVDQSKYETVNSYISTF